MKKTLYVLCLSLMVFISCSREDIGQVVQTVDQKADISTARGGDPKIMICHFAKSDNIWELLEVNTKSLGNHLKHGDVRLDDQDGDGYVPDNECGYGKMGDNDDNDACNNPENNSQITNIRLGGQTGDNYIGPTCSSDGTYRTCFYVTGTNLPGDVSAYHIKINDVEYPIAFFKANSTSEVVVCVEGLNGCGEGSTDVLIQSGTTSCSDFKVDDLYVAPNCGGEITNIRLGGQTGDNYIGPTCSSDGTYRTCYYVTGTNLPSDVSTYHIKINDVEYPIAFFSAISSNEVVICVTGLNGCGEGSTDVSIETNNGCSSEFTVNDLYDAPDCGGITNIRLGGQTGDNYIGPTCSSDGTYRTCYYVTGTNLPGDVSTYHIKINGLEYPIAFFSAISSSEVVICVSGLNGCGEGSTDVSIQTSASDCSEFAVEDLYIAPDCGGITNIRLGGQTGDNYIGPTCSSDGTFRTCFYVTGTNLSGDVSNYNIKINNLEYPIAFFSVISSDEVVVCVSGITNIGTGIDVSIKSNACLAYEMVDLFDAPNCSGASRLSNSNENQDFFTNKLYNPANIRIRQVDKNINRNSFTNDLYSSPSNINLKPIMKDTRINFFTNERYVPEVYKDAVPIIQEVKEKWLVPKN